MWLCNLVIPELCDEFGFREPVVGGWLTGMWDEIKLDSQYELAICIPIKDENRAKDGKFENYKYYSFQWQEDCDGISSQIHRFIEIIEDFNPDVIHIWGTEYIHTYSMVMACINKGIIERVLINIQGLLHKCTECYQFGLGSDYSDSILESMILRRKYEIDSLSKVYNVSGRTEWDKNCVKKINPEITYYHCGEILRNSFYRNANWDYDKCDKHTILISQANYSLKGFHLIIRHLADLFQEYPDLMVRVCGKSPMDGVSDYGKIIERLIKEYNLENVVLFVGLKSEQEMLEEFLKANVFLSTSLIENSSNSVCEALSVGLPVVASNVGGMSSIIENGSNGLLYPLGEEERAVEQIKRIFEDKSIASRLSRNEMISSQKLNGRQECINTLKSIYDSIYYNK